VGLSSRVIGGLIMTHGDDRGLRLPPRIAPVQCVVVAVKDEAIEACERLTGELIAAGVRARLDAATQTSFGRRAVDHELKGIPLRIEVGPRDLEAGVATRVRRDRGAKEQVRLADVASDAVEALEAIQASLYDEAQIFRDRATSDVASVGEVDGSGLFRLPWATVGEAGEASLAERGYTVRALTNEDGSVPRGSGGSGGSGEHDDADLVAWVAKAY